MAPSLKSAEKQWATDCGKSSQSPCCSTTVNCDAGFVAPVSRPLVTPDCSSAFWLFLFFRASLPFLISDCLSSIWLLLFAPASWPCLTPDFSSSVRLLLTVSRGMVVLCDGCVGGVWLLKKRRCCEERSGGPNTEAPTSMVAVMLRAAVVAGSRDIQSACPMLVPLRCSIS